MEPDAADVAAEMEVLVGHCLKVAERLLNGHGGDFQEFAAWLDVDGDLFDALDVGEDLTYVDRMDLFDQGLREKAALGELRAAAVCLRVTVTEPDSQTGEQGDPTDAVCVRVEHRDGGASYVLTAFERTFGLRRRWKLGERRVNPTPRSIFDEPEGS